MAFNNLFKGTEYPVAKEIESLQLKKASVTNNLRGEIRGFEAQIQNKLLEAGTVSNEARQKGIEPALDSIWADVDALYITIAERDKKIEEFTKKYDEEMALLGNTVATAVASNTIGGRACPQCGAGLSEEDVFCQNCGNRCS